MRVIFSSKKSTLFYLGGSIQKNFYTEQVWLTHEYYKWTLRTGKLAQCKCFIGRRYGDRAVKALQPLQKGIGLGVNDTGAGHLAERAEGAEGVEGSVGSSSAIKLRQMVSTLQPIKRTVQLYEDHDTTQPHSHSTSHDRGARIWHAPPS